MDPGLRSGGCDGAVARSAALMGRAGEAARVSSCTAGGFADPQPAASSLRCPAPVAVAGLRTGSHGRPNALCQLAVLGHHHPGKTGGPDGGDPAMAGIQRPAHLHAPESGRCQCGSLTPSPGLLQFPASSPTSALLALKEEQTQVADLHPTLVGPGSRFFLDLT